MVAVTLAGGIVVAHRRRQPAGALPVHHLDPGDLRRVDLARVRLATGHQVGGHPAGGRLPDDLRRWCRRRSRRWSGRRTGPRSWRETAPGRSRSSRRRQPHDVASGPGGARSGDAGRRHARDGAGRHLLRPRRPDESRRPATRREVGLGRFNAEVWVLSWFGVDFSALGQAAAAGRPVLLRRALPVRPARRVLVRHAGRCPTPHLDRFFARAPHARPGRRRRPTQAAVEAAYARPAAGSTRDKLFPGTGLGDPEAGAQRLHRLLRHLGAGRRDRAAALGDGDHPMSATHATRARRRGRHRQLRPVPARSRRRSRRCEWAAAHGADGVAFSGLTAGAAGRPSTPRRSTDCGTSPREHGLYLEWGGAQHVPRDLTTWARRRTSSTINRDAAAQAHGARRAHRPVVLGRADALARRRAAHRDAAPRDGATRCASRRRCGATPASRSPSRRTSSSPRSNCSGSSRCATRRRAAGSASASTR